MVNRQRQTLPCFVSRDQRSAEGCERVSGLELSSNVPRTSARFGLCQRPLPSEDWWLDLLCWSHRADSVVHPDACAYSPRLLLSQQRQRRRPRLSGAWCRRLPHFSRLSFRYVICIVKSAKHKDRLIQIILFHEASLDILGYATPDGSKTKSKHVLYCLDAAYSFS